MVAFVRCVVGQSRGTRLPRTWPHGADDPARAIRRFRDRLEDFRPGASDNWVLEGRHTANGRSMVVGDPHQGLSSPAVFHMQHLRTDEGLDVIGFGFVGTPAIQLGHNRHLSWTATTSYPDWMDLVDVADDGEAIILGGERIAVVKRMEQVDVRGGSPRMEEMVDVPGIGVLLPDDLAPVRLVGIGHRILLRWMGFQATIEGHSFLAMDQASTLEEFDAAVDSLELGAFNFIYADRDSIAYRSSPIVPDRGEPGTFAPRSRLQHRDDR